MDLIISIFIFIFIILFYILFIENINKNSLFFKDIKIKKDVYFSYEKIIYAFSRSLFRAIFISIVWIMILFMFYGFYLLILEIFNQNNINLFFYYCKEIEKFTIENYNKLLITNADNFNSSLLIALLFSLYSIITLIFIYFKNIFTETISEMPTFNEFSKQNITLDKEISIMLNPSPQTLKSFQLKKDFIFKNFIFFENINNILCIVVLWNIRTNESLNLAILIISFLIISYSTTLRIISSYLNILKSRLNILHKIQLYFISPLISISTIYIGYLYLEIFSHMIIYILLITTLISFILIHFGEKIRKHIKDLIVNKIIENEKFRNFLRIIKNIK